MLTIYMAYEFGYRAAVAGQRRRVPAGVRQVIPNVSHEWFRGYDEAQHDCEAKRERVLANFGQ